MRKIIWYRVQRVLASVSVAVLVAGGALLGGIIAAIGSSVASPSVVIPAWVIGALIGGAILLIAHAWAEYRQRTYDPSLIFKFDERFNNQDMKASRCSAAKIIKENLGRMRKQDHKFSEIDPVLDFFEDLGFYQRGHQVSPEVLHHEFYYWIRGYYTGTKDYIDACRQTESA